jgi:hypothetical protein
MDPIQTLPLGYQQITSLSSAENLTASTVGAEAVMRLAGGSRA